MALTQQRKIRSHLTWSLPKNEKIEINLFTSQAVFKTNSQWY